MSQHRVVVALGSNLGDSAATLTEALREMSEFITKMKVSSFYHSAPVGGPEQPDYLNAVFVGETELAQEELLSTLQEIETRHGRVRVERWGARTLDLDLIDFDSTPWRSQRLILPHPRAHERAFVLVPWHEIDPDGILIGHGPIATLIEALNVRDVVRV